MYNRFDKQLSSKQVVYCLTIETGYMVKIICCDSVVCLQGKNRLSNYHSHRLSVDFHACACDLAAFIISL